MSTVCPLSNTRNFHLKHIDFLKKTIVYAKSHNISKKSSAKLSELDSGNATQKAF